MDMSAMSNNPRCGSSDFSIERLLSDGPRKEEGGPNWLCCTRYRPPRVPRPAPAAGGGRVRRAGRHARVPFSAAQAAALEAAYGRAPYLAPPALRALAAALQLRDARIKIWFQNRRARERREKTAAITPPAAMTLPSTASQTLHWTPEAHSTMDDRINCIENKLKLELPFRSVYQNVVTTSNTEAVDFSVRTKDNTSSSRESVHNSSISDSEDNLDVESV